MTYTPQPTRTAYAFTLLAWLTIAFMACLFLWFQQWRGLAFLAPCALLAAYTTLLYTPLVSHMTISDEGLFVRMWPRAYEVQWRDVKAAEFKDPRNRGAQSVRFLRHDGSHTRWISFMHYTTNTNPDWPERIVNHLDRHGATMTDADRALLLTGFTDKPRTRSTFNLDEANRAVAARNKRE